ncbi:MAG: hypothetical protein AAGF33_05365 [Pseudomonadota bacterium]
MASNIGVSFGSIVAGARSRWMRRAQVGLGIRADRVMPDLIVDKPADGWIGNALALALQRFGRVARG